jgi:metal-sulfur cluster biosynthetic enzyme
MKKTLKKDVINSLKKIIDPELGINIVDLGLIYKVSIYESGRVNILMTLTTLGCPLAQSIKEQITKSLSLLPGIKEVEVELTFDPPWSIERMSDEAKGELDYL